jgi:hypothetical protein
MCADLFVFVLISNSRYIIPQKILFPIGILSISKNITTFITSLSQIMKTLTRDKFVIVG